MVADNKQIDKVVDERNFIEEIKRIVSTARGKAYSAVNYAQVEQNWLIGQRIVEREQGGESKAAYGKYIIKRVSDELTAEFGKGFSYTNIFNCRRFFLEFKHLPIFQTQSEKSATPILQTLSEESASSVGLNTHMDSASSAHSVVSGILPWSHYERLLRVHNKEARAWYEREAYEQMWGYRTLDRNISTQYYERMLLSQTKDPVEAEMKEKTAYFQSDKLEFIKNPTVLEFLGLPGNSGHKEKDLETAILKNLQQFLLEMGKGFALAGNQQIIRTDMGDFYIDLVFYNYILKCFVLIDLKVGRVTHQDIGQMDMYVRMYDELRRTEGDNPTIGIVLCSETSNDIARYSILKGNEQIFAAKYELVLPKAEELQREIERQSAIIKSQLLR